MEELGLIPVRINAFINPATVWASELLHPQASEECRRLYELECTLSQKVNSNRHTEFQRFREVNEDVAVRSIENEHKWHRGKITDCLVLAAGHAYKVFLVDHGITLRVKPHQIRDLPYNVGADLPHQAMILQLEDLVPMTLEYVPEKDRLKQQICAEWTISAEKLVEDIYKNYAKVFFKEGSTRKRGNKRFGDLLIHKTNADCGFSLSKLLIDKKHASHCPEEFYRRYLVSQEANDAPVICRSPLMSDCSSGRSSRCTPSPDCASLMGSSKPQKRMSIEEFLKEKQQRSGETPTKDSNLSEPEETATVNQDVKESSHSPTNQLVQHESQHQIPANPKKTSRMAMLAIFKEAPASSADARKDHQEMSSDTALKSPPETPANTLGVNFVPAGKLLKSEAKAKNSSISISSRGGHPKDHTRALDSRPRVPKPESVSDLSQNRNDYSRKLSIEEMEEHEARPKSVPITSKNTPCKPLGTDNDVTQSPSSHSDKNQQRLKMLCGANSNNLQNNSSKIVTTEKEEHEARPMSVPIIPRNESSNSLCNHRNTQSSSQSDISLRMLRDSTSATSVNQISEDRYLARHVLLHGGFAPKPWMAFHDLKSNFTPEVETWLISRNFVHNILTLEKFMWPALLQRQNVVMISPPKSGKTSSYVIPLVDCMNELEQMPKGHGPLILILCSGSETADQIYSYFLKILTKVTKKIRINVAYGLATGKRFLDVLTNLINGCEVLITTPPFLLRILKEYAHNYALDLQRLCHYVIDQADILMTRHLNEMKEIQSLIVAEQCLRAKNDSLRDPIQIIVSSEKWEPNLLSFSKHLRGNPLLCINDCYEACVYGKPDVYFHNTCTSKKPTQFLNVVKNIAGLHKVVVFCEENEVSKLEEFLDNGCVSYLVARTSLAHLQGTLSSWETSKYGQHYVMLTTDDDFDDTKIQDATCVVHYSLPTRDFFVKRLSAILGNLPNMFEKKHFVRPEIHILRDETNEEQLPRIVQLMRRISDDLDPKLLAVAEDIARRREKDNKVSKPFCTNVKMFGHCWKRNDCLSRHVCIPDIDFTDSLPQSGLVTMQVLKVHSACHLSVRLTEHSCDDGTVKKFPSAFLSLGTSLFNYFSNPENKTLVAEINSGDIFALQTKENLFVRVQVEDIIEKDKFGKATYVQVKHLDYGQVENAKTYMLFSLPESIKTVPAQAIDLFLSGLLPADQDTNFGKDANMYVKELIQEIHKEGSQVFQGKIILSMTGSLWVDCLKVVEWLPHTHVYVEVKNINQCLLQRKFALENPSHMQKLCELTGRGIPAISPSESRQHTVQSKPQPTPCWAFLESDVLEDVSFSYAEDVSHVFIRRTKFQTLLDSLLKDVEREVTERKTQEDVSFHPGYICLATFDEEDEVDGPKWHRVQLLSLNEDGSISAYYVDHGDVHNIDKKNLTLIPDWAITKLPFQAIECSLAGVSSTNSVDILYELVDHGAKDLKAKVCERRHPAKFSGGNHYLIAMIDSSKPDLSIINKEFVAIDGVECSKEELKFLDFDINSHLTNTSNVVDPESPDSGDDLCREDLELDLSDLEFKEDDLSAFHEDEPNEFSIEGFDTCGLDLMVKDFQKAIPSVQELAAKVNLNDQKSSENVSLDSPSSFVNVNKSVTPKISSSEDYYLQRSGQLDEDSDWEDDVVFAGRHPIPLLCSARPPQVKWFEDLYHVWMKLCITDVKQYFLKWSFDRITFSACVRGRLFHLDQQLRGIIVPDSLQCSAKGFTVEIKMEKACSGVEWGRLFYSKRKFAWVSRDLEVSAMSSDDSDVEISLDTINKEIRKIPLKKRRYKPDPTIKDKAILPDMSSDVERSDEEYDMIDSDECF